ncbi:MAG: hypothetical protein EZS28_000754 [Streblomastix strix]|uniref:Uncharacterized protein n=1 Tax=Streblomastix strix TaxID=222440 RepID=A0A5J4X8W9_9EUKA|nr:MAG: hypothetical protein EZS28_000754 [Streblomastix strix]
MRLLLKVVEYSEKSRKLLIDLVEANPSNTQVIRALGVLLRDIDHSSDEAQLLFIQANNIEDEITKSQIHQIENGLFNRDGNSPSGINSQNTTLDSKTIFNILAQNHDIKALQQTRSLHYTKVRKKDIDNITTMYNKGRG